MLFGAASDRHAVYRRIVARMIEPRYARGEDDHDLALLWLDGPAPVAPLALLDSDVDHSLATEARVVGFGEVGGGGFPIREKQQGTVSLDVVRANSVTYGPAPAMTCRGDSGGPVFIDVGGTEVLFAVTTSGDLACVESGVGARVDVHLDAFIRPALATEGPPRVASAALGEVCTRPCATDADCPADLVCWADRSGTSRCVLPDVPVGVLGETCQSDAACTDGPCVPIDDECRCDHPCGVETVPTPGTGCSISNMTGVPRWVGFLFPFTAFRRRQRRGATARCNGGRSQMLGTRR